MDAQTSEVTITKAKGGYVIDPLTGKLEVYTNPVVALDQIRVLLDMSGVEVREKE